jgi:hypothetical protein
MWRLSLFEIKSERAPGNRKKSRAKRGSCMNSAMARLLLFPALLCAAPVAFADWVKIGGNDAVDAYMDLTLLDKKGTYVMSWRLYDYRAPQKTSLGKNFSSAATLDAINCADRTEAMISFIQYDQPMGKGNIVDSRKLARNDWKITRVAPKSIGEELSRVACTRYKMW